MAAIVNVARNNDDWKMCRQWILEILPELQRLRTCTSLIEFASKLRDGLILSRVFDRICPGAVQVDQVHQSFNSLHFCLSNISSIRRIIIERLGVAREVVFTERELADLENFYQVLLTLSIVSHLRPALAAGAKAWPPQGCQLSFDNKTYQSLGEMAPAHPSPTENSSPPLPPRTSTSSRLSSNGGDRSPTSFIESPQGNNTILLRNYEETMKVDGLYENLIGNRRGSGLTKSKREYAIQELIETEEAYVETLSLIVMEVMHPSKAFMETELWDPLFRHLAEILSLHMTFLEQIKLEADNSIQSLGIVKMNLLAIWQKRKREFLVYAKYVVNHSDAKAAYDRMTAMNGVFQKFTETWRPLERKMRSFTYRDLLVLPIQRVLKYHLLLDAIAKYTTDKEEQDNIQQTINVVVDIQRCINEAQRDGEMLTKIGIIENAIDDLILPPGNTLKDYGRLLLDGEMLIRDNIDKQNKERVVFLMDYLLIICESVNRRSSRQSKSYKLRQYLLVDKFNISINADTAAKFKPKGKFKYPFEIKSCSDEITYSVAVRSEAERDNWIKLFQKAKQTLHPPGRRSGGHQFDYKSFEEPWECCVCGKMIAGSFYQGYECAMEYCKMTCHQECLSKCTDEKKCKKEFFPSSSVITQKRALHSEEQDLSQFPWFCGKLSREEASVTLAPMRSGTFLVRESVTVGGPRRFAISIKYDANEMNASVPRKDTKLVNHFRVEQCEQKFSLSENPPFFRTLGDLVSYYQENSMVTVFNQLPTRLVYPYQRNSPTSLFNPNYSSSANSS